MKVKMTIEYNLDETSFSSIKDYCFLRSLVALPEGVRDKNIEEEREAYKILSWNFQLGNFDSPKTRDYWFHTVIKNLGYPEVNANFYRVYTYIQTLLNNLTEEEE